MLPTDAHSALCYPLSLTLLCAPSAVGGRSKQLKFSVMMGVVKIQVAASLQVHNNSPFTIQILPAGVYSCLFTN